MGFNSGFKGLTLILLTWSKWWAPNNASKYQMGFNSGFKELSRFSGSLQESVTVVRLLSLYELQKIKYLLWPCCCLQELCSSYSYRFPHQTYSYRFPHQTVPCLWLWIWNYCRLSGWDVMQNSGLLHTLGLLMLLWFERRWIWTPFCVYSIVGFVYNSPGSNRERLANVDC